MAIRVIHNAKLRNTSICGATETILIHNKIVKKFCNPILKKLEENNCEIFADKIIKKNFKGKSNLAKNKNWSTEYLSSKVSVKSVKNIIEAIEHINKFGTMHTDSIITKNKKNAKLFLNNIKSSIAMHNTSTQFADGGEFGFGGEVGISTNKLPPRGPVGLNQLISFKYKVLGNGQIRKIIKKKIGILGGSFDPAHMGHIKISLEAKKKFKLNKVIWAVTKKNPFKLKTKLSLKKRIKFAKKLNEKYAFIKVKFYENTINSNKTIKLINYLKKNYKNTDLFFIMGADNLINFHKWDQWKKIAIKCRILVFDRSGYKSKSMKSISFKKLNNKYLNFVKFKKVDISSSQLRKI